MVVTNLCLSVRIYQEWQTRDTMAAMLPSVPMGVTVNDLWHIRIATVLRPQ